MRAGGGRIWYHQLMSTRREFFSGKALRETSADVVVDPGRQPFVALGATVRLSVPAMVSDFEVILNPGPAARLEAASAALELVEKLEDQMSVYRFHSELSLLNRRGCDGPVVVERRLFDLLCRAVHFADETAGRF